MSSVCMPATSMSCLASLEWMPSRSLIALYWTVYRQWLSLVWHGLHGLILNLTLLLSFLYLFLILFFFSVSWDGFRTLHVFRSHVLIVNQESKKKVNFDIFDYFPPMNLRTHLVAQLMTSEVDIQREAERERKDIRWRIFLCVTFTIGILVLVS